MPTFRLGDVVQLNSGGPKMTITSVYDQDSPIRYATDWFTGSKREDGLFPEAALQAAPPDEKGK
jgi:uncharacterized protein YodC (DUF2158 family)